MARTDNINNFLTDVASAIKTKKGDNTPIQASSFDTEIANLSSGVYPTWRVPYTMIQSVELNANDFAFFSYIDFSQATTLKRMFYYSNNIVSLPDISNINQAIDANFEEMFNNCNKLGTIGGAISLTTSSSCNSMFNGCVALQSINFSLSKSPNYEYAGDCGSLFYGCTKLTTITSTGIQASSFRQAFMNCSSLVTLPQLNMDYCNNIKNMCKNCTLLENVPVMDLHACSTSSYNDNVFNSCPALTNTSLNNILASLATLPYAQSSTSGSNTKKLSYYGLSQEQATTCTTLSNWQVLSEHGWVTGY